MRLIDGDELLRRHPDCRDLTRRVEEMPTVDAAPVVHGHWILHNDGPWKTWTECSVCLFRASYTTKSWVIILNLDGAKYCLECGARMDYETQEEE